MRPWVVITQNEGYVVDTVESSGADVAVLFVDYSESKENVEYAQEMLESVAALEAELPASLIETIRSSIYQQHPTLAMAG